MESDSFTSNALYFLLWCNMESDSLISNALHFLLWWNIGPAYLETSRLTTQFIHIRCAAFLAIVKHGKWFTHIQCAAFLAMRYAHYQPGTREGGKTNHEQQSLWAKMAMELLLLNVIAICMIVCIVDNMNHITPPMYTCPLLRQPNYILLPLLWAAYQSVGMKPQEDMQVNGGRGDSDKPVVADTNSIKYNITTNL